MNDTMLNIKFWEKPSAIQIPHSVELSFSIDKTNYFKTEEEISTKVPKAVVKVGNTPFYLIFPNLSPITNTEIKAMEIAKAKVIDILSNTPDKNPNDFASAEKIAVSELSKIFSYERSSILGSMVAYDTVAYGPLSLLIEDSANLEEIEVNSPTSPINVYHSRYGRCATNLRFNSEEQFRSTINRFIADSEKELGDSTPIIDVQVSNARIHAQLKPYSLSGACATIRLGGRKETNIGSIVASQTVSFEILAYLWLALENRYNIVVSGPPASGKTSLLISLLSLVPRHRRIITIEEDVNELQFYSNVSSIVSLYGSAIKKGANTRDQVINALRMRPEMLVIGEIRGEETRELFAGANLGIPFLTTMHSNEGGSSIIKRLIVKPMAVEPQAISTLDLSIQMSQKGIDLRTISEINEYRWLSRAESPGEGIRVGDDTVCIVPIVKNCALDTKSLRTSKVIEAYAKNNELRLEAALLELKKRSTFLKQVCSNSKSTLEICEKIGSYGAS